MEFNKYDEEYNIAKSHKDIALNRVNDLLAHYLEEKDYKKVHLLSYWFEYFTKYNLNERYFDPKFLIKYKRGSIIKANLGFNVGSEEGGLHYCIVLDKKNNLSSKTLTVIPLTSIKENKKYSNCNLNLGDEIYVRLNSTYMKLSNNLSKEYSNIWNLPPEKISRFTENFEYLKKIEKEIAKMKKGSIALINQITTISKQRIYNPTKSKDILSNIRVSNKTLNLIDEKIKENFIK